MSTQCFQVLSKSSQIDVSELSSSKPTTITVVSTSEALSTSLVSTSSGSSIDYFFPHRKSKKALTTSRAFTSQSHKVQKKYHKLIFQNYQHLNQLQLL